MQHTQYFEDSLQDSFPNRSHRSRLKRTVVSDEDIENSELDDDLERIHREGHLDTSRFTSSEVLTKCHHHLAGNIILGRKEDPPQQTRDGTDGTSKQTKAYRKVSSM